MRYVYKITHENKIPLSKSALLIGPFLLVLLIHIINIGYKIFINNDYEIPSHFEKGIYVYLEFLSCIFNLLLIFFSYRIVKNYEEDKTYNIKWVKSETNWLKN